nr:MAG TPA: hypothetical protein [Caudoviricetes sp.]
MIPSICVKYKVEYWIKISSAFYPVCRNPPCFSCGEFQNIKS